MQLLASHVVYGHVDKLWTYQKAKIKNTDFLMILA